MRRLGRAGEMVVEELHGRCAVVIMSGGPLRILDWVWVVERLRPSRGGRNREGQKKKKKKEGKKVWRKVVLATSSRGSSSKPHTTFWLL